jgi:hypothetical protein
MSKQTDMTNEIHKENLTNLEFVESGDNRRIFRDKQS